MRLQVLLLPILQNNAAEEIISCTLDKRVRVTRDNNTYRIELCTSMNRCTDELDFIEREEVKLCELCRSIPGINITQDCQGNSNCKDNIDSFQNGSCINKVVTTVTQSTGPPPCTYKHQGSDTTKQVPAEVFGAVTGLLLVILVLVITGWVWTYLTMMKKNKGPQICTKCQVRESEEERFCSNQLYEMTTTEPVEGTAIEQLLDSLEGSGQSNNGLSSKDNKGYRDVKRVENFYSSSEGSTQSSLQEQAANRVEEGESGEKHVYHVLEKPGDDDYEEPDKDLEENTAMDYETPVPVN